MTNLATRNSGILAIAITSLITGSVVYWTTISTSDDDICRTKECMASATRILMAMDSSANPCDDFYQYVCGGWMQANPIPDDKSAMNQFVTVTDRNKEELRNILDSDYSTDRPAIRKVKMLYRSCMGEDTIEDLAAQPVLNMIAEMGGMPLFGDSFDSDNFDLEEYLVTTRSHYSGPIVAMYVAADGKNSSKNVITLDQPALGMPGRDYYLSPRFNKTLLAYRQYMKDYLREVWKSKEMNKTTSNFNETSLNAAVDEIINLETDLAKILVSKSERLNINARYKKYQLKDMAVNITDKFNWVKFVTLMMSRVDIAIKPTIEVVSYGTPYFSKFTAIVEKYGKRTIKDYIVWMHVRRFVSLLSKKFRDTQAVYRKAVTGTSEEKSRWETCTSNAYLLSMALSSLFVKNMFSEDSKQVMEEMTENIMSVFVDELRSLSWMDDTTKDVALVKVDAMTKLIGYPAYIADENDPRLDEEYAGADVTVEEYFESIVDIYHFDVDDNLAELAEPVDKKRWSQAPAEVNAYYHQSKNLMAYPAGILQPPFFDPGRPFAMNYGAIGSIIGHELTHGFDTKGSRFNENGNLVNWWSNFSEANFQEKAQCVRDQYSGFFYETAGMHVNGNLTIGENVADLAGIRLTYEAYKRWKESHASDATKEFRIPGLQKFTPEQLLFIADGQIWCQLERPERARSRIATSYHSPSRFRVFGALKNFPEFGKAFGCTQGEDKLYPPSDEICRVW